MRVIADGHGRMQLLPPHYGPAPHVGQLSAVCGMLSAIASVRHPPHLRRPAFMADMMSALLRSSSTHETPSPFTPSQCPGIIQSPAYGERDHSSFYIHCGLDFILPAGTPVTAVGEGYVAAIYTNYPDWITHHFFIVAPKKGVNRGWCYTHVDPRPFTFKGGDSIRRG